MTDSNEKPFPLWQKILYGVLTIIFIILVLWGADKIGLLGILAGAGF